MKNENTPERLARIQDSSKSNNTSFELMLLTSLQHLINNCGTLLKSISHHFNNKLGMISSNEKKYLLRIYQELNHLISILSHTCRVFDITEVVEFTDFHQKFKHLISKEKRASNPLEVAKKPPQAQRDQPKKQTSPPVNFYYHRIIEIRTNKHQIKVRNQNMRPKKMK
jgi:hypothetical protein